MRAREPEPLRVVSNTRVCWGRRTLLYFGGCDYYRLSRQPAIREALQRTLAREGLSVAASRLTTGNHPLYGELEQRLCRFFGSEAALLVPTGFAADLILAQGLAGQYSHCLIDAGAHSALVEAAASLGCPTLEFASRSVPDLEKALRRCGPQARPVLLTDGLFSADGSVAPLAAYDRILPRDAVIVVDDAHGAGVLGATGKGTLEAEGVSRRRIVQTVTLSKAFGVYGGAILTSRTLRRRLVARSPQFAGSTPIPLPLAGAAIAALNYAADHPGLAERLRSNSAFIKQAMVREGLLNEVTPGPMLQLFPASKGEAATAKAALLRGGIYPLFTNYHAPEGEGYFRFVMSSEHKPSHLRRLVGVLTAHRSLFRGSASQNPNGIPS